MIEAHAGAVRFELVGACYLQVPAVPELEPTMIVAGVEAALLSTGPPPILVIDHRSDVEAAALARVELWTTDAAAEAAADLLVLADAASVTNGGQCASSIKDYVERQLERFRGTQAPQRARTPPIKSTAT